jgi:hypothetical protein
MKLSPATLCATALVLGLTSAGCGRKSEGAPAGTTTEPAPTSGASGASGKASDKKDGKWEVQIKPVGTYKAGSEGKVEVVVTALGDFHVNDDYPAKFKAKADSASASYPKAALSRQADADAFKADACGADAAHACTLHVIVPVKTLAAGKAKVGGTMKFGVCSAANCIMEGIDLELDVDVTS